MRILRPALIPLLLTLLSCGGRPPPSRIKGGSPGTGGGTAFTADYTCHLDEKDPELARIAVSARDNLPIFLRHLRQGGPGEEGFRVKCPFKAERSSSFGREQLWLGDIGFSNNAYHGTVLNTPFYVPGLAPGDWVVFSMDDITDWMFIRRENIIGGRSIKYLLEQIPSGDRDGEQKRILEMF
jgi:uncharacterized protein YegJ (DUF2314 family)